MGINQFTDMTQEEFENTILMPAEQVEDQIVESPQVGNVDWVS